MAPTLTEFPRFSALPAELRFQIWESVPQTPRILGMLACPKCTTIFHEHRRRPEQVTAARAMSACAQQRHPDWQLRWCVLATDDAATTTSAIFAPLHACRESRALWLPRYVVPPRYLDLEAANDETNERHRVRFDVPFVSYETDVFSVFGPEELLRRQIPDPLLGFDRERIEHLGVHENAWSMVESLVRIQPQRLRRLRSITFFVLGPNPVVSTWFEMAAAQLSLFPCTWLDLPDHLLTEHPLFTTARLRNKLYMPDGMLHRLENYRLLFQAWLWHALRWDDEMPRNMADSLDWWAFRQYVEDPSVQECPLSGHPQWCPGRHTRDEMLQGFGPLGVQTKLLIEKGCLAEMKTSGTLDWDPTGAYTHFFKYKNNRMRRLQSFSRSWQCI